MNLSRLRNSLGVAAGFLVLSVGAARVSEAGFLVTGAGILELAQRSGGQYLERQDIHADLVVDRRLSELPSPMPGSNSLPNELDRSNQSIEALATQLASSLSPNVPEALSLKELDYEMMVIDPQALDSRVNQDRGSWVRHAGNANDNSSTDVLDAPPSGVMLGFGIFLLTLLRRR
jgi:hypothetical protein